MAILRVRQNYPTIQSAVDAANPGDVILVADGIYPESISISKSYIRILAECDNAVLDGGNTLDYGFNLFSANGIEIRGLKINGFHLSGINVVQSNFNRFIRNSISNSFYDGISIITSTGNLVWKNTIFADSEAVYLNGDSNWIIKNCLYESSLSGIDIIGNNNAVIDNEIEHNKIGGFITFGNNLFLNNRFNYNADTGNLLAAADNTVSLLDHEKMNSLLGTQISVSDNVFVSHNEIDKNVDSGLGLFLSNLCILEKNELEKNTNYGILVDDLSINNLVYKNDLDDNKPLNLLVLNPNNNLIDNYEH